MNEVEFDKACTFLLERLRDMFPSIAKDLTKKLKGKNFKNLSPKERKVAKIRILHNQNPDVISQVFAKENAAWAREERSDMSNFFYMLDRKAVFLNPHGEITGGNYSSRA